MPTHPFVHHHRHHLKPSDVFVASYPRSGNTWMRLLLADLVQQNAGLQTGTNLPIGYERIIPDLDFGYWPTNQVDLCEAHRLFKTHSVYHPIINKALVVIRNPADCLCSYFHFFRRLDPSHQCIRAGIDAFCAKNVSDWCVHVNSYLAASRNRSLDSFWTSYEQLHAQPLTVLKTIATFLGMETSDAVCQIAIENQSFERHRASERLGSEFHEYFFRVGQLNSGKNELRDETIERIERKTSRLYDDAVAHIESFRNRSAA